MQLFRESLRALIQARASDTSAVSDEDIKDLQKLAARLTRKADPVSAFVSQGFVAGGPRALTGLPGNGANAPQAQEAAVKSLDKIIDGPACIYEGDRFKGVTLRPETSDLMKREPTGCILPHNKHPEGTTD